MVADDLKLLSFFWWTTKTHMGSKQQVTYSSLQSTFWQGHLSVKNPFSMLSWPPSPNPHHLTGEGGSMVRKQESACMAQCARVCLLKSPAALF